MGKRIENENESRWKKRTKVDGWERKKVKRTPSIGQKGSERNYKRISEVRERYRDGSNLEEEQVEEWETKKWRNSNNWGSREK